MRTLRNGGKGVPRVRFEETDEAPSRSRKKRQKNVPPSSHAKESKRRKTGPTFSFLCDFENPVNEIVHSFLSPVARWKFYHRVRKDLRAPDVSLVEMAKLLFPPVRSRDVGFRAFEEVTKVRLGRLCWYCKRARPTTRHEMLNNPMCASCGDSTTAWWALIPQKSALQSYVLKKEELPARRLLVENPSTPIMLA